MSDSKESTLEEKIEKLQDEKIFLEKDIKSYIKQQNELTKEISDINNKIYDLRTTIKNLEDKNVVNHKMVENITKKIKDNHDKLHKVNQKLNDATMKKENQKSKIDAKKIKELETLKKENEKLKKEKEEKDKILKKIGIVATESLNPDAGIYLFKLGTAKDLCDSFVIPKDRLTYSYSIYKFGLTNDVNRRKREHKQKYEKFKNVSVELCHFKKSSIISNRENENRLFEMFRKNGFAFINCSEEGKDKFNELVCINDNDLYKVKKFYDEL